MSRLCTSITTLLLAAALFGLLSTAALSEAPLFDLLIEATLGQDIGQPLGSLFEARDEAGRVIFGAGFPDVHSTYLRDNNRLLCFFHKDRSTAFELATIEKPYDADHNGVRLMVDRNDLLAFFREFDPVRILRLTEANTWVPAGSPWDAASHFGGLQYVNNRKLVFGRDRIEYDGHPVFASARSGLAYYVNGRFFIVQYKPARMLVLEWRPDRYAPIVEENGGSFPVEGNPFVFGAYNDDVLMATNIGNVYVYKNGALEQIRKSDGKSWQAYSMVRIYDRLLIGHYPTGSLFAYDAGGLAPFLPAIPVPANACPDAREAQTLAVYCGDLYAGLWPWGELWRYDPDLSDWRFVARLFDRPAVTKNADAPYAEQMKGKPGDYNYWGQRIVSLVNYRDSLYIGTMNKQGKPFQPEHHAFLDAAALAQYGRVFRLRRNAQLTTPFTWKPQTSLRFVCDGKRLKVYQDAQPLGEVPLATTSANARTVKTIRLATGIYGDFNGSLTSSSHKQEIPSMASLPALPDTRAP